MIRFAFWKDHSGCHVENGSEGRGGCMWGDQVGGWDHSLRDEGALDQGSGNRGAQSGQSQKLIMIIKFGGYEPGVKTIPQFLADFATTLPHFFFLAFTGFIMSLKYLLKCLEGPLTPQSNTALPTDPTLPALLTQLYFYLWHLPFPEIHWNVCFFAC